MSSLEILKSEHLKYVCKNTEYTVYGFIRQLQKSLDSIIAELVYKICLAFYAEIDRWNGDTMDERIEFNPDTQTIKNISKVSHEWTAAFGELKCKTPNIYHWKLKMNAMRGNKEIMIGVINQRLVDLKTTHLLHSNTFAFWSYKSGTSNCCSSSIERTKCDQKLEDGDVVEMKLDLKEYTLSFVINDKDYGVVIKDIAKDIIYCLGVAIACNGTEVTLSM